MYDGFKLNISYLDQRSLTSKEFLNFETRYTKKNHTRYDIADFYGLTIMIKQHNVIIQGSFHKFYNRYHSGTYQNYTNFTFTEFREVLHLLSHYLGIQPERTMIENLEIGVNFHWFVKFQQLLSQIVMYEYTSHFRKELKNESDNYYQYQRSENSTKSVKIYDKASQHGLSEDIGRYEVRAVNNRAIGRLAGIGDKGHIFLSDLLNPQYIRRFKESLLFEYDKFLIVDSCDTNCIPAEDRETILKGLNPNYWKQVNQDKGPKRSRVLNSFKQVANKYNLLDTQQQLRQTIESKIDETISTIWQVRTRVQSTTDKEPFGKSAHVDKECNLTTGNKDRRYCKETEIEITDQKKGSEFLREKKLARIYIEDKELFEVIESKYKPARTRICYNELEYFKAIAKQIRDTHRNKKKSRQRKAEKYKGMRSLFHSF